MQTNRPQLKQVEPTPLPEHRQRQVEAGLATFQSVIAERDNIERKFNEAVVKIDSLTQQLEHMTGIVTLMESTYLSSKAELEQRVREYQQQRDLAVAKHATLEAHLVNLQSVLNNALVHQEPA